MDDDELIDDLVLGLYDDDHESPDDGKRLCYECNSRYYDNQGGKCDQCEEWICGECQIGHDCKG